MEKTPLGKSGLHVSAIGLGCMGMSEFYGATDERQSVQVLNRALELGINFFDTADMYGPFKNEELLGRTFANRAEQVIIATKFAVKRGEDGSFLGISGKPDYVKSACEASLRRLQVDAIDLYYQHRVDPETPIEDTVGAMADLVKEGKVRYIGLSEAGPKTIRRAAAVHPITALQTEYSIWSREPEDELLATCEELGIAFVAYSPLGRGFLSGQIRSPDNLAENDYRSISPRFQGENFQKNLDLVDQVRTLAEKRGCTAAQLALAWARAQGNHIIPIPGTTKLNRLEENAGSVGIELTQEELAAIDALAPKGAALGDRYDARGMTMIDG